MRPIVTLLALALSAAEAVARQPEPAAAGTSVVQKQPPPPPSIAVIVIDAEHVQVGTKRWRVKGYSAPRTHASPERGTQG
jgi:hypothetical protein